jgi:hypothetical protein
MASWLARALLLALWLVGMVEGNPWGPWIHVLLAVALVSLAGALMRGESTVRRRAAGG